MTYGPLPLSLLIRLCRTLLVLVLLCVPGLAQALSTASGWRIGPRDDGGSRFVLDLSAPVGFAHFVLASPDRVVIDLTQIEWQIAPNANLGGGLVAAARYGNFKPGVTRIVLDLGGPARVQSIFLMPPQGANKYRLVVDLAPTSRAAFMASVHPPGAPAPEPGGPSMPTVAASVPKPAPVTAGKPLTAPNAAGTTMADRPESTIKPVNISMSSKPPALPPAPSSSKPTPVVLPTAAAPPAMKPSDAKRRVIVIDPGHGGVDPGAISVSGVYEKTITLATAKELKRQLEESGRYRVVLTRDSDEFVRLRDRVALGRSAGGQLFLSLHADAIANPTISGLSVYTLSETASDKEAEALAAKENKADLIAGVDLTGENNQVSNILIALAQRETKNHSARFAGLLVRELEREANLLPRNPHRFAGLAVLTGPDMPAVLLEMGYLSNRSDERKLNSPDHRRKLARGILRAIDGYFAVHH